ncbi:MAG TPA: hypothetical protein ENK06_08230, partial [Gammaproteobacteria bacterium]|nr:hypothetical protein [Gammaproteobacteria bacterium]
MPNAPSELQKTFHTADAMPGELLVKFKQPRSSSQMLGKASRYKARLKSAFTNIGVEHWVLNDSVDLAQTIESLKNDPDVLIVE